MLTPLAFDPDQGLAPRSADLPLLNRLDDEGRFTPVVHPAQTNPGPLARSTRHLLPGAVPGSGEQYRFAFDMTKCVGCKCCVVACNEQNANPPGVTWRRVGEVEGGEYPHTRRHYLSMGCNHCVDPACLNGCPTEAYVKAADTGLVLHSAQQCIGCQYCTWNCPYGVPQYNPQRKVVGKCDMCHGRVAQGLAPACVAACPQEAITIEVVNVNQWVREALAHAEAPELPRAGLTLSTTRLTLPADMPVGMGKADAHLIRPEHPHTPLMVMTTLTQVGLGVSAAILGLVGLTPGAASANPPTVLAVLSLLALTLTGLGLTGSLFHLGRPVYALRAIKGWRKSWLSREVIGLSAFMGALHTLAGVLCLSAWGPWAVPEQVMQAAAAGAVLTGLLGVYASARLYIVPARPSWDSWFTLPHFFLPGLAVGLLMAVGLGGWLGADTRVLLNPAVALALGYALLSGLFQFWLRAQTETALKNTGLLYRRHFGGLLAVQFSLWALAFTPAALPGLTPLTALGLSLAALISLGMARYLFFVTVVPRNMPGHFFAGAEGGH